MIQSEQSLMKGGYTFMDKLWIKILIIIALQIAIILIEEFWK